MNKYRDPAGRTGLPPGASSRRQFGNATFIAPLVIAAASVAYVVWYRKSAVTTDFDLFYYAARCLRFGTDPYQAIGPGRQFDWITPFYYPLPAVVLLAPLAWLPLATAHAAFVGASSLFLAYGIARSRSPWLLVAFFSQAYLACVLSGQWSILLLAAFFLPWLRAIVVVKPNIGLAVIGATESGRQLWPPTIGTVILLAISFALRPDWAAEWLGVLHNTPLYRPALEYPGGILLLLALIRWRRVEARYLAILSIIPQIPGLYSDLLIFAVPETKWEVLILVILSHATLMIYKLLPPVADHQLRIIRYGIVSVPVLMLPALVMVLTRPNQGPAPAILNRAVRRLPKWLRGTPPDAGKLNEHLIDR